MVENWRRPCETTRRFVDSSDTNLGAGAEVRQYEGRPAPAPQGGGRGQQGQLGEVDTPATT